MDAIKASIPEIVHLAPRLSLNGDNIVRENKFGSFDLRAEMPDMFQIEPLKILEGRKLNDKDIEEYRKVIVIGKGVQEILYEKEEEVLGTYIKIKGAEYQVVGLFEPKGGIENRNEQSQTIFMPLSTGQRNFNIPGYIDWFVCSVEKEAKSSVLEDEIKEILKSRHKVSPEDKMAIGSFNLEKEFRKFQGLFSAISTILWIVGIGTLLAGMVGVGNVMLIVVKERTREIGIRKALGATPASIIQMVMLESIFITLISGFLGLFFGTLVVHVGDSLLKNMGGDSPFYDHPEVSVFVGLGALVILILAGALAGWIPARQAARINPVLALKDE